MNTDTQGSNEARCGYVALVGRPNVGKSTLMNAVSSAYVSEISSLPAYPCLVFVQHGEKRSARLQSYDGAVRSFDKQEALYQEIESAHSALAERIRSAEDGGDAFHLQTLEGEFVCPEQL